MNWSVKFPSLPATFVNQDGDDRFKACEEKVSPPNFDPNTQDYVIIDGSEEKLSPCSAEFQNLLDKHAVRFSSTVQQVDQPNPFSKVSYQPEFAATGHSLQSLQENTELPKRKWLELAAFQGDVGRGGFTTPPSLGFGLFSEHEFKTSHVKIQNEILQAMEFILNKTKSSFSAPPWVIHHFLDLLEQAEDRAYAKKIKKRNNDIVVNISSHPRFIVDTLDRIFLDPQWKLTDRAIKNLAQHSHLPHRYSKSFVPTRHEAFQFSGEKDENFPDPNTVNRKANFIFPKIGTEEKSRLKQTLSQLALTCLFRLDFKIESFQENIIRAVEFLYGEQGITKAQQNIFNELIVITDKPQYQKLRRNRKLYQPRGKPVALKTILAVLNSSKLSEQAHKNLLTLTNGAFEHFKIPLRLQSDDTKKVQPEFLSSV